MSKRTPWSLMGIGIVCLAFAVPSEATTNTRTSPAGGALPANITEIGGIVADVIGFNSGRMTSQLAASSLFEGYGDDGTPVAFRGNPLTIGEQSGFTPAILNALGGGIQKMAVRVTLEDGDTGPGDFDLNDNFFLINGINVGDFSAVATEETSSDGLSLLSSNPAGGFRDDTLDTGFFLVTDSTQLGAIFAALASTGKMVFQLQDNDPYDNYFDFTAGVDGGLINSATAPTTVVGPSTAPKRIVIIDAGAMNSVVMSGLPMVLAHRELMVGAAQAMTRDLNARLFRARAGVPSAAGRGDAEVSAGWSFFAAGDLNQLEADTVANRAGFESDVTAGSVGGEYTANENLRLGLACTVYRGDTDVDGLGTIDVNGIGVAPYLSVEKGGAYADLLYGYGAYENDVKRDTLTGFKARGEPDSTSHTIELNGGYNVRSGHLVFGPIAGIEYRTGSIDSYSEENGDSANLRVEEQDWDSLITRIGAQVSYGVDTGIGRLIPQLRLSWDRENQNNDDNASVMLLTSPTTIIQGNSVTKGAEYGAEMDSSPLGTDYMNAGAGLMLEVSDSVRILLDYEGHYFRDDGDAHFGSLKICWDL